MLEKSIKKSQKEAKPAGKKEDAKPDGELSDAEIFGLWLEKKSTKKTTQKAWMIQKMNEAAQAIGVDSEGFSKLKHVEDFPPAVIAQAVKVLREETAAA
ncbi:MAG: hypothetical protein ACE5HI_15610, partial [bacterium]